MAVSAAIITAVRTAVLTRYGGSSSEVLTNLTTPDGESNTSVDNDILDAAIVDAVTLFERITTKNFLSTSEHHIGMTIPGVIHYLEWYKNRDTLAFYKRQAAIIASMKDFRESGSPLPITNSDLDGNLNEKVNQLPDMHRRGKIWRC